MRSTRLIGVVLAAATGLSFHPSIAEADVTAWSTNAAACVPVSQSGLLVTAGAVTAQAGSTVTLYCGITSVALAHQGFDSIEITYEGGTGVVAGGGTNAPQVTVPPRSGGLVSAELIEMSKATGAEAPECGIEPKASATIATARMICENSSSVDFNNNFYYLRIIVKSGIAAFQQMTVYGSSLISTR
jgi:hypothetical protein